MIPVWSVDLSRPGVDSRIRRRENRRIDPGFSWSAKVQISPVKLLGSICPWAWQRSQQLLTSSLHRCFPKVYLLSRTTVSYGLISLMKRGLLHHPLGGAHLAAPVSKRGVISCLSRPGRGLCGPTHGSPLPTGDSDVGWNCWDMWGLLSCQQVMFPILADLRRGWGPLQNESTWLLLINMEHLTGTLFSLWGTKNDCAYPLV